MSFLRRSQNRNQRPDGGGAPSNDPFAPPAPPKDPAPSADVNTKEQLIPGSATQTNSDDTLDQKSAASLQDPFVSPATAPPASQGGGMPKPAPSRGPLGRLRASALRTVNALAPFTLAEPMPRTGTGSGGGAAGVNMAAARRRLVRRAGSAALGSIPTLGRLRRVGNGSITGGLRVLANRNPIYRFFLSRLPLPGKVQAVVAVGCGCSSGCGCASSCCSCVGCIWPVIIIFIVIGLAGVFAERQPGFVKPLFCERSSAAFCTSDSTSLTVALNDLPPGSVEDYQAVEAETGVPWFYLAAWEKVATDFGRADFSDLHGGSVPGTALDASYNHLALSVDGILNPDGNTANLTAEAQDQAQQAVDEQEALIKRLTSSLRGGSSFGLMLVTNDEYEQYGQKEDGTWLDPWNRKEAAQIIAHHLLDLFPELANANNGTLTYDGTPDIGLLDRAVENWIHQQLLRTSSDPALASEFDRFMAVTGRAGLTPKCTALGGRTITAGSATCAVPTAGTPTETWWDGPHVNQPITQPERFYVCQSILPETEVVAGACDEFLAGTSTLTVDPNQALNALVAVYYDRTNEIVPGQAVSDWGKLQILFGALFSSDPEWGADQSAYYLTPQITADGRTGEKERVNSYAQAILIYGHSVYASWAAAQLAARSDTGAGRAEAADFAFWNPPATTVEKDDKFPREYLLATIEADGAFGCQPGQGLSVPDAATTDWMDPLSVQVGKGMAQALDFTGLAWIPLAVQMQFENGGDVKGNNPYNVTDKAGHTAGVPTYADRGQTGWWDDGANHWFAVFDTLAHGAAVSADLYLSNDQNDYRGYGAVVRAGRAGDLQATALAIEASLWSQDHYGGNHFLPTTSELFQPDQPERAGKIVHNSVGVQVASIGGCWRFGEGSAAPWTPPAPAEGQKPISEAAIAMNFCITSIATAPGGCGTATLTVGERTATFPVLGFWDGGVGEPGETYAGLTPEAAKALDLSGQGPWQMSIELNKPAEAIWPVEVYGYATPLEAVQALAAELRGLARVATPAVPNLGQLAPAWRAHAAAAAACSVDRIQAAVQVPDPYTAGVSYAVTPWCQYLDDAIRYTNVFLGGASGGEIATLFGVQGVSRFGYIWPIVGTHIGSGFQPRSDLTNLSVTFSGQTANVHNGLDLFPPSCQGQVVADKAGWLYTRQVTNYAYVRGVYHEYLGAAVSIVHDDGLTSEYAHVGGQTLDPDLAAALATSTTAKNGYQAVYVRQGTRIASLDGIACHLHFGVGVHSASLPYTYSFGGDPLARYQSGKLGETYLDIDALRVLPWDPTVLKPNTTTGTLLPAWYYTVYGPTGLPPAFVPAELGLP